MPGVMGELREERPLGAAVALTELVQGVDVSEEPARAVMNGSRARPRSPFLTPRPNHHMNTAISHMSFC